jgi:hypothetical protein
MNRLTMIVLKNIFRVPGLYAKRCHYAKNTEKHVVENGRICYYKNRKAETCTDAEKE